MAVDAQAVVEGTADAIGQAASDSWGGAIETGVSVALSVAAETDAGAVAAEWGKAVATGVATGAAAGAACGPAAPICSTVGAIAGALIALGVKIAELFDGHIGTHPCRVFDFEFVVRPCPNVRKLIGGGGDVAGDWKVTPFGMEERFWTITNPGWPKGLSLGFILWTMRRSREDMMGLGYLREIQRVMGMPIPKKPSAEEIARNAQLIARGSMGKVIGQQTPAFWLAIATAQAGGDLFDIYRAAGIQPRPGQVARYNRTKKMLDAEFQARFGKTATTSSTKLDLSGLQAQSILNFLFTQPSKGPLPTSFAGAAEFGAGSRVRVLGRGGSYWAGGPGRHHRYHRGGGGWFYPYPVYEEPVLPPCSVVLPGSPCVQDATFFGSLLWAGEASERDAPLEWQSEDELERLRAGDMEFAGVEVKKPCCSGCASKSSPCAGKAEVPASAFGAWAPPARPYFSLGLPHLANGQWAVSATFQVRGEPVTVELRASEALVRRAREHIQRYVSFGGSDVDSPARRALPVFSWDGEGEGGAEGLYDGLELARAQLEEEVAADEMLAAVETFQKLKRSPDKAPAFARRVREAAEQGDENAKRALAQLAAVGSADKALRAAKQGNSAAQQWIGFVAQTAQQGSEQAEEAFALLQALDGQGKGKTKVVYEFDASRGFPSSVEMGASIADAVRRKIKRLPRGAVKRGDTFGPLIRRQVLQLRQKAEAIEGARLFQ
jgi:hypothetical protein